MFREGRHLQNTHTAVKKLNSFFHQILIDLLWQIDIKSLKKHEKRNCVLKSTKNRRLESNLSATKRFSVDFWAPPDPQEPPGTFRVRPSSLQFFHRLSVASENQPGTATEAPGSLQASSRHVPDTILNRCSIDFSGLFRPALFPRCVDFLSEVFALLFFSSVFRTCS